MLLADVAARERLGTVSAEEAPLAVVDGADVSFEVLEALYGAVADRARLTHCNCGTNGHQGVSEQARGDRANFLLEYFFKII